MNREFVRGVEFVATGVEVAEVMAMDQIMLGNSHWSAQSEFRNIYNSYDAIFILIPKLLFHSVQFTATI